MKSVFKWILRALGVLLGLVVLLLVVAFFVVNSNSFQQRMLDRAVTLLEEKLQTRVAIDSVNVDLWTLDAPGKFVDLSCDFSFTNTSEMQKMKVKPRASLHLFGKKSDEQKAQEKTAKAQEKAAKALQKAEAKQRKADAKAAKKAAKAQRKAAKKGLID